MKKIDIPEIYPENIIELFFGIVYEFDYTEEAIETVLDEKGI